MRLSTYRVSATLGVLLIAGFACDTQRLTEAIQSFVASISISPKTRTLRVGDGVQLSASVVTTDNSPAPPVNWTSTNPSVAAVSPTGMVGALAAGSTNIRATSGDKSDSALIVVELATVEVASVVITPPSASIYVGAGVQLSAVARDGNGTQLPGANMAWASLNTSIAQVSAAGLVTGLAVGSASIIAFTGGKADTASITVMQVPVASVDVSPTSATIGVGQTRQLQGIVRDAGGNVLTGRVVTWSTSSPSVATVSTAGLVSGVGAGSATITATSEGHSGTAAITVTAAPPPPPAPVAAVEVAPRSASIQTGQTTQLQATLRDAGGAVLTGRSITWTTSSASVATVSSTGLVTGVAAGSATITATSEGKSGTSAITVTAPPPPPPAPVASVEVSPSSATIGTGQTRQLQATLRDASGTLLTGRSITWSSSSAVVATVSSSGLVTGIGGGSATITATSEGRSGMSSITVTAPPPPPPPPPGGGLLISASELAALPMSGAAWSDLKAVADGSLGTPDLTNQDNKHSVQTLAVALVAARTGDPAYREKARLAILAAIGTEQVGAGNSILALGRILGSYVLAADLIGLSGADATAFRAWLDPIRTRNLGGHSRWYSLKGTCEDSSNNWGAFACASLIAANLYLGDAAGVARSWQVFQGFTGDRAAFVFPDVSSSWRCTGAPWTPINVASNCGDKLGAPPEDAHRAGDYPTIHKTYTQETMQGLAFQAELLQRAGYPAWERLRLLADFATRWSVWNASAVGTHLPWWYNKRLGINAPTESAGYGRLFGYTDWLYGS